MKIAVTGCNGNVGKRVVLYALKEGHDVVGIDFTEQPEHVDVSTANGHERFNYIKADLRDFDTTMEVLKGCEAVVALAAFPNPGDFLWKTHNSNVVISWNVLRACAEIGIKRIAQASTVNVLTLCYSNSPKLYYFPLDEEHPCEPDEPYGLSKVTMELQSESIVRRYPDMRIASLRLHYTIPDREYAMREDSWRQRGDLWGWVQQDSAADAFLRAITVENGKWSGHEAFFIVAPDTVRDQDSRELHELYWAHVPVKEGKSLEGRVSFYDCTKAERLLGWKHKAVPDEANAE